MATTSNEFDFMKYRAPNYSNLNSGAAIPSGNSNNDYSGLSGLNNSNFNYPSYDDYPNFGAGLEQPSSWLHGTDFNTMAGDLFTTKSQNEPSYGNISLNLDQIKIGDQTMENVLKALDPSSTGASAPTNSNSFLNGLNLDSSFTFNKRPGAAANNNTTSNFDYLKPANRSSIIKNHLNRGGGVGGGSVTFQQPPASQFFSNPDESFVNMTLPVMDTSIIFSDSQKKTNNYPSFKQSSQPNCNSNKLTAGMSTGSLTTEKEQFVSFAVQQYKMLAAMNPEMMRTPDNLEELSERETFKYWAKLFVEERERQARIMLNMQKALTEALSGAAAKGPNVLAHLGAASGDFELETIGKYADNCRKRSQMISNYFNQKRG